MCIRDSAKGAGTEVRLDLSGNVDAVPEHVSQVAYRILQESLTNVMRHAEQTPATVRVSIGADSVDLVIADSGSVRAGRLAGVGHGIAGMRERAVALGGTLDAGRDPVTGGWKVSARLPWN